VAVLLSESVTFTVNVKVPVAVGVPLMIPVLELRDRGANEPEATVKV
jgi:hypothetical protein